MSRHEWYCNYSYGPDQFHLGAMAFGPKLARNYILSQLRTQSYPHLDEQLNRPQHPFIVGQRSFETLEDLVSHVFFLARPSFAAYKIAQ